LSADKFLRNWWSVLLAVAIYATTLAVLEKDGFWIVDNAHKFLQLESLSRSGYDDYSLSWPGMEDDRELLFLPVPPPFSVVHEGRVFSVFSPLFPMLSSLPYRFLGGWGLYLLPLAASVLMLGGISRLATLLFGSIPARHLTVLLAGLCTPVWFYSVVFWEHALAVCCMTWAVFFLARFRMAHAQRDLVLGFASAALGIYFRDELYLFAALLALSMIWTSHGARLRCGATAITVTLMVLAPLWVFHWMALGSPAGFHLGLHLGTSGGLGQHLRDRPQVFYNLLLAAHESRWTSLLLTAPFLGLLAWRPRLSRRAFLIWMPTIGLASVAVFLVFLRGALGPDGPIVWLLRSNSLLPAAPYLALGALRLRPEDAPVGPPDTRVRVAEWIQWLALSYALAYALAAPLVGSSGIHWGNRFLLALYPLLGLAAAWNLRLWFAEARGRIPWRSGSLVLVVVGSLVLQLLSLSILHRKRQFSSRLNHALAGRAEEVVVTDVWWAPQELHREFPQRTVLYLSGRQAVARLPGHLAAQGIERFLYLTRQPTHNGQPAVIAVDDGGLGFFSLYFYGVELSAPRMSGG
jgi:hypothetical protein